jgi:hypothetical protein
MPTTTTTTTNIAGSVEPIALRLEDDRRVLNVNANPLYKREIRNTGKAALSERACRGLGKEDEGCVQSENGVVSLKQSVKGRYVERYPDFTSIRIPRYSSRVSSNYSGYIGALYVVRLPDNTNPSQSPDSWDTKKAAKRNTKLRYASKSFPSNTH